MASESRFLLISTRGDPWHIKDAENKLARKSSRCIISSSRHGSDRIRYDKSVLPLTFVGPVLIAQDRESSTLSLRIGRLSQHEQ